MATGDRLMCSLGLPACVTTPLQTVVLVDLGPRCYAPNVSASRIPGRVSVRQAPEKLPATGGITLWHLLEFAPSAPDRAWQSELRRQQVADPPVSR
jgi:hypothetical protein